MLFRSYFSESLSSLRDAVADADELNKYFLGIKCLKFLVIRNS